MDTLLLGLEHGLASIPEQEIRISAFKLDKIEKVTIGFST